MPEGVTLEQEIATLERMLQEKRAALEEGEGIVEEAPSDRELLEDIIGEQIVQEREAVAEALEPATPAAPVAQTPVPPPQDPQAALAQQVQQLVDVAFSQGLKSAISQAVKTNNAALVDAFHDTLVDDLYTELVSRNVIKQPEE